LIYTLSPFLSCNTVLRLPVDKFLPSAFSFITSFTHNAQCRCLPPLDLTVAFNYNIEILFQIQERYQPSQQWYLKILLHRWVK
jgi:hypothetical protein